MRGTLVRGALAVTSMIALAFGVPIVLALQRIAADRALLEAQLSGRSVQPIDLTRAWLTMGGIAVLLIAGSVIAADRLGVRTLRALDAEREVAADLSHRLRTPLTALRLDTDALPPGPVADRMRQAVEALDAEIDAIILSARSSAAVRASEKTDLVDVLAERLAFWAVLAEDHGRRWEIRGAEHPIHLKVPRADLIAAVDALLGNVFEHTPQGTPFRVTVSPGALVVEDGGPGIADATSALRRGAGASGLGLDIASRVARLTGGSVVIARSEMGGARITMILAPPK
ncbi:MAG TPA: HAMP domain-containing sensor histidine kinase [Candidatus Limnocylindrales bacterium]|nr:HAMP domain-containing sensor histidine kinase [Candidatus Limnocylindrales bacterium]